MKTSWFFTTKNEGTFTTFEERQAYLHEKIPSIPMYEVRQEHTDCIHVITQGETPKESYEHSADAIIYQSTYAGGIAIKTADCVPILLFDNVHTIAGIHSGWRGTDAGITTKTVQELQHLGIEPEQLTVVIGPSICGACYQRDLKNEIIASLYAQGIQRKAITVSEDCTAHGGKFHSYRATGKHDGTIIGAIWMH